MKTDGKQLENLIRQIEELLLPQGFVVQCNRRIHNDAGVTVAEFDVEISGRVGSVDMNFLVECRDRKDPAPASWIEQLVGRRDRFGFNKVMAVSTAGFAPGAKEYADQVGIELRTVADMRVEELPCWLGLRHVTQTVHRFKLDAARLVPGDGEPEERIEALRVLLESATGDDRLLRAVDTGERVSLPSAFRGALRDRDEACAGLTPNGPGKSIKVRARYPHDESHFVVDTNCGPVRIREILFRGEVRIEQIQIPFEALKEYRRDSTGETIAQVVSFPLEHDGSKFALEMHNLADTGETHVLLRKL